MVNLLILLTEVRDSTSTVRRKLAHRNRESLGDRLVNSKVTMHDGVYQHGMYAA
jgi:hypothetical protein